MNVKVLGTGCDKCRKLYAETEKAIAQSGLQATLEKVEKMDEIARFRVMTTPALVIDGEVKCSDGEFWTRTSSAREPGDRG